MGSGRPRRMGLGDLSWAQGKRGSQYRIQRVHPDVGFPRRMGLGDFS